MALLAVVMMGAACREWASAQTAVRLEIRNGVPVVDGVLLNGGGPYRFIVDTGSQTNHLDPAIAAKLGIRADRHLLLDTPSGESKAEGGQVRTVTVGSMEATDQEFVMQSFGEVRRLCPDVVGILGQEFLGRFDYVLDLQHRRLVVGEPPTTGLRVPFRRIAGRMALATSLGDLILDSGAESLMLFKQALRPAASLITTAEGSRVQVATEGNSSFRIGERTYWVQANFLPVRGAEEAGLLPAGVFRAIYVSNSQGYVLLDPKLPK